VVQEDEEASLLLVRASPIIPHPPPLQSTTTAPHRSPAATSWIVVPLPRVVLPLQRAGQAHDGSRHEVSGERSGSQIEIREQKVFAQLGEEVEHEAEMWVLDTGATNHMSGSRAAFAKLDTAVLRTMHFADDSAARIEGRGTVTFMCKNGELRSFDGVDFIPRLTMNIMSIGQLNEVGYKIKIDDAVMRIQEPDGQLLARVPREENRLYLLRIRMA
jgi:hypothetical protein